MGCHKTPRRFVFTDMDTFTSLYDRLRGHVATHHRADAVWIQFLDLMDALPVDARLAYLLSDVFGAGLDEIASSMARDPASCRALIVAARSHMRAARPSLARS